MTLLTLYISHIIGYQRLMAEVESTRRTLYSSDNEEHEALLKQVSELLNGYFQGGHSPGEPGKVRQFKSGQRKKEK